MHDLIIGILLIIFFVVVALAICSPFDGKYKNENERNKEIKYMTFDEIDNRECDINNLIHDIKELRNHKINIRNINSLRNGTYFFISLKRRRRSNYEIIIDREGLMVDSRITNKNILNELLDIIQKNENERIKELEEIINK